MKDCNSNTGAIALEVPCFAHSPNTEHIYVPMMAVRALWLWATFLQLHTTSCKIVLCDTDIVAISWIF